VDRAAGVEPPVAAMAAGCSRRGTTLVQWVLEATRDAQYHGWAGRLLAGISGSHPARP
jgi:hypothetical protein